MVIVRLQRPTTVDWSRPCFVPFPEGSSIPPGWVQQIRQEDFGIPVPTGYLDSKFVNPDDGPPFRAVIHHLGLFVRWEDFTGEALLNPYEVWDQRHASLDERLRVYGQNIHLLCRSAEDARVDAKAWAEKCAHADILPREELDDAEDDYQFSVSVAEQAVLLQDFLSFEVQQGRLLRDLSQLAEKLPTGSDILSGSHSRDFSEDPSHAGISAGDVQDFVLSQRKTNEVMLAEMFGEGGDEDDIPPADDGFEPPGTSSGNYRNGSMDIRYIPKRSWLDVGEEIADESSLNTKQRLVLLYVARHLDLLQSATDAESTKSQKLIYVGGGGGVGKSHLIHALVTMFQVKGESWSVQVTAQTGAAAANITGRTLHSALGLNTKGVGKSSSGLKSRWKRTKMLIHDEVSMTSGEFFHKVSERIGDLCDMNEEGVVFGGIPIVMVLGDFAQFEPVGGTSLVFPSKQNIEEPSILPRAQASKEPSAAAINRNTAHYKGFKIFEKFRDVIILDEQMRAKGDPELVELLNGIRAGEPPKKFYGKLKNQVLGYEERIHWEEGIRAITPRNTSRWRLNMDAVLSIARSRGQACRIFISSHTWDSTDRDEKIKILGHGDNSHTDIPGIFFYTDGMPVIANRNQYPGLKVMNGTEFVATGVVISNDAPGFEVAPDVFVHFGPPAAILLQSEATAELRIQGLPSGTVALVPEVIELQGKSFSFLKTSGTRCKRRGIPCTPAYAITDHKAQGRTFLSILVELAGRQKNSTKFEPISAYVSLSRCRTLAGIKMLCPIKETSWKDVSIPPALRRALGRLEECDRVTRERWSLARVPVS